MDRFEFKEARLLAAMDRKGVSELLRVTVRTVANWEKGRSRVPYSAYRLVRMHGGYDLPGEAWQGWRLHGDTLWSPEDRGFRAHEVVWWGLTCEMARAWQAQYQADADGATVRIAYGVRDAGISEPIPPTEQPAVTGLQAPAARGGHPPAQGNPDPNPDSSDLGERGSPEQAIAVALGCVVSARTGGHAPGARHPLTLPRPGGPASRGVPGAQGGRDFTS